MINRSMRPHHAESSYGALRFNDYLILFAIYHYIPSIMAVQNTFHFFYSLYHILVEQLLLWAISSYSLAPIRNSFNSPERVFYFIIFCILSRLSGRCRCEVHFAFVVIGIHHGLRANYHCLIKVLFNEVQCITYDITCLYIRFHRRSSWIFTVWLRIKHKVHHSGSIRLLEMTSHWG